MKIQVNQGQNIIKILSDDFSSCLVIEKALTINWPDSCGSIGEYYSISNHSSQEREKLSTELNSVLINGSENEILKSLNTFLNLFSDGEYEIHFYTLKIKEHLFFGQNQNVYSETVPENERFSGWFYPFSFEIDNIFNTIPNDQINPERVDFYVDLINQGSRPKIMLLESYNENLSQYSSTYILDGHHKLEAYLKLGIDIPAVKIVKQDTEANDTEEILKYIQPILKDFEFNHYLKHNDNIAQIQFKSNPYLTEVLDNILQNDKNPGSNISALIINIAISENDSDKWLKDRLNALAKNKYMGKGLYLYYKGYDEIYKGECMLRFEINTQHDLKIWLKKALKIKPNIFDLLLSNFWF